MKLNNKHGIRIVGGLATLIPLVVVLALTPTNAQSILKELPPTDPPEVLRLNHNYNLKVTAADHGKALRSIARDLDARLVSCGDDTKCRPGAVAWAREQSELERRRYELRRQQQVAEFQVALEGAEKRLQAEQTQRDRELQEQRESHDQEREKMTQAMRDEWREAIKRFAEGSGDLDAILDSGEAAMSSGQNSVQSNVADRFRPRRQEQAPRQWRSRSEDPKKQGEGSSGADSCESPRCLVEKISRLEALLRLDPGNTRLVEERNRHRKRLAVIMHHANEQSTGSTKEIR